MAWTQADLDALQESIKRGVRVVQFDTRRVEYPSIEEMLKLRAAMKEEIETAAGTTPVRVSLAKFFKQ